MIQIQATRKLFEKLPLTSTGQFADALMNTLLKCGATEPQMEAAQQALRPLQVDTDCNRSVQDTLNRMKGEIEHLLWYDQANIAELSGYRLGAWLADSPRNVKDCGSLWPKKEMLALLSRMANADGRGDLTMGENRACLVQGQTTRKGAL